MKKQTKIGLLGNGKSEKIECFVCKGAGKLQEKEILMKLGGEDLLNLLQMSQQQFFDALEDNAPALFEQVKENLEESWEEKLENLRDQLEGEHRLKLQEAVQEKNTLLREKVKLENDLRQEQEQLAAIQQEQQLLSGRKGKLGELEFEDWIGQFPQFECIKKLRDTGDYIVKVKRFLPNGNLELMRGGEVLVDSKKGRKITEGVINQLFSDAKTRNIKFAFLFVHSKEQFRGKDKTKRILERDGITLFKGDADNFLDDMSFLEHFIALQSVKGTKEQADKLRDMILAKAEELEEFREIETRISRETRKIGETVDKKKREINEEIKKIMEVMPDETP